MNCEQIKEIVPSYIKHTAQEDEISRIEEHLCICNNCREYLSQLMDKTHIPEKHAETLPKIPTEKDSNTLEYIMLGLGIIVLFVVIFLLIKG